MPSRVITIRLTTTDLSRLRLVAQDVGLPLSTVIRAAVADYVADLYDVPPSYPVNTPCITPKYR